MPAAIDWGRPICRPPSDVMRPITAAATRRHRRATALYTNCERIAARASSCRPVAPETEAARQSLLVVVRSSVRRWARALIPSLAWRWAATKRRQRQVMCRSTASAQMSALAMNPKPSSFASKLARSALDVSTTVKGRGQHAQPAGDSERALVVGAHVDDRNIRIERFRRGDRLLPDWNVGYDVEALGPQQRSTGGAGYVVVVDEQDAQPLGVQRPRVACADSAAAARGSHRRDRRSRISAGLAVEPARGGAARSGMRSRAC